MYGTHLIIITLYCPLASIINGCSLSSPIDFVNASTSSSIPITGTIQGRLLLPETTQKDLPPLNSTLITLNNGEYSTYSTTPDGQFTFSNIPPGVHVLDVQSTTYHFSQIKIQLLPEKNNMEPNCIEYVYPGATKYAISHPLILTAHATYTYFEKKPSFSPFRIFKNPMVLMMVVSVGFMFLMPSMMSGLDEDQKKQMKEQMELQKDPQKMFSQMWGGGDGSADSGAKKVVKKKGKTQRLQRE